MSNENDVNLGQLKTLANIDAHVINNLQGQIVVLDDSHEAHLSKITQIKQLLENTGVKVVLLSEYDKTPVVRDEEVKAIQENIKNMRILCEPVTINLLSDELLSELNNSILIENDYTKPVKIKGKSFPDGNFYHKFRK